MPNDSIEEHLNSEHDFYALLSIPPISSDSDIRRAYRKTALKYHPDKQKPGATSTDNEEILDKFHLLRIAHDILVDPKTRDRYDAARAARQQRREAEERLEGRRRRMKEDLERRESGVKRARDDATDREQRIRNLAEDGKRRRKELEIALRKKRDELRTDGVHAKTESAADPGEPDIAPTPFEVLRNQSRPTQKFSTPTAQPKRSNDMSVGGSAPPKFSFDSKHRAPDSSSFERSTLARLKMAQKKRAEEKVGRDGELAKTSTE